MKKVIVDIGIYGHEELVKVLEKGSLDIIGITVSPDAKNYDDLAVKVLEDVRSVSKVPVFKGAQRPLLDETFVGGRVCDIVEQKNEFSDTHAVKFITDSAQTYDELEIICLGALSNIALAILKEEEAMKKVKRIYVAGGALLGYQTTTCTSYMNILADAEAAETVFKSGIAVTLVPMGEITDVISRTLAVAEGCEYESWDAFVTIDTSIGMSRGQTVIDTVGYNLITMEPTPGRKQTVVTSLK